MQCQTSLQRRPRADLEEAEDRSLEGEESQTSCVLIENAKPTQRDVGHDGHQPQQLKWHPERETNRLRIRATALVGKYR